MVPLAMCKEGDKVVVKGIAGGRGIKTRLEGLGIVPGTVMEVLKSGPGPVVVKINSSRVALGFGEAMKIYVEEGA
jgi:ferrous iron transport protein A